MSQVTMIAIDLVAVTVLTFGLYFPRHRRRDLVVAYLGVNVGVLAVTGALSSGTIGVGLGLGLFGVLSIIRLRSSELDQDEIAYYFSALALGLLGGLNDLGWTGPTLMALVVAVMFIGDHPWMLGRYRRQVIVVDSAIEDHEVLVERLELILGARVHVATTKRIDLVNDTTTVDVRYEIRPDPSRTRPEPRTLSEVGR